MDSTSKHTTNDLPAVLIITHSDISPEALSEVVPIGSAKTEVAHVAAVELRSSQLESDVSLEAREK